MAYSIEEMNQILIKCRTTDIPPQQDYSVRGGINSVMLDSIKKHRDFNGITSDKEIRLSLESTSKYCKTTNPHT